MNTDFFFAVWNVYQDHWGKEQQDFYKKHNAVKQLKYKLTHYYYSGFFEELITLAKWTYRMDEIEFNDLGIFLDDLTVDYTFEIIRELASACFEEPIRRFKHEPKEYHRRFKKIYIANQINCNMYRYRHQWFPPNMHPRFDDSLRRVFALITLS